MLCKANALFSALKNRYHARLALPISLLRNACSKEKSSQSHPSRYVLSDGEFVQFFGSNSLTTTNRDELRPFQVDRKDAVTSYFRNITTNKEHNIDLEITRRNNVDERRRKKNELFLR